MTAADTGIEQALAEAAEALEADLREVFGFEDVEAQAEPAPDPRLIVHGEEGRFEVSWPPDEALTEAEGRLGAHARIAFELLLASSAPATFFDGYRPQTDERRELLFDHVEAFVDDSLRENPYYTPLAVVRRGPAMLVYGDDEYTLVAEDGSYRGEGILHWKVKRLVAFALTDVDEQVFGTADPDEVGPERWDPSRG